jgi:hypothetical protein
MAVKCFNILQSKALENLAQLDFRFENKQFFLTLHQNGWKYTKLPLNVHKIYIMAVIHIPIFKLVVENTNLIHSKVLPSFYPIWDIWFENIPSGNPAPLFAIFVHIEKEVLVKMCICANAKI